MSDLAVHRNIPLFREARLDIRPASFAGFADVVAHALDAELADLATVTARTGDPWAAAQRVFGGAR